MKLKEIDPLDAQCLERGVQLTADVGAGKSVVAVHEGIEVVAEFGGDDPAGTVAPCQIIADELFGCVIAVAFGGVNQIDAEGGGGIENGVRFALRVGAPPFAAELPCADADDGHFKVRYAESSVAHMEFSPVR